MDFRQRPIEPRGNIVLLMGDHSGKEIEMKWTACLTMVLAGAFFLGGCSRSHEDVMDDMVETMEETANTLESVKDKDSANAAAGKLDKLAERMNELSKEAEDMEDPDEATEKELKAKYEERMSKAAEKMMSNLMRIAMNPELSKELGDSLEKLKNAGKK